MFDCAETLPRMSNTHLPTGEAIGEASVAGSRASENWEVRVEGPNGFERTYTLANSAGEHEPEAIRSLILQLLPVGSA